MCIDAILESVVTVWVLGIIDVVMLVIAFCAIAQSEKSTYDFEKMCNEFKNKNK